MSENIKCSGPWQSCCILTHLSHYVRSDWTPGSDTYLLIIVCFIDDKSVAWCCHITAFFLIQWFWRSALQWRQNERNGISNQQPHDCLLNFLFRCRSKKPSKLHVTGLCEGNSPVNSLHKGPVTRKMFSFDDVIMKMWHGIAGQKCFYTLLPSNAIPWQPSGSTLALVMACCLMAPSHYLNQCWLNITKVQWYSSDGNFKRDNSAINL